MKVEISRSIDSSAESLDDYIALGDDLLAQGELVAAAANYCKVLSVDSRHWVAGTRFARALQLSKQYEAAEKLLRFLVAEHPENPVVHKELGKVHCARRQYVDAIESFQNVARLNPHDSDAHHWLANVEELRGNAAASHEHFQRAVAIDPLLHVPAAKTPAEMSVLLIFARGAANTPPMALLRMAEYDSYFLLLAADVKYDIGRLRKHATLIVNLISDVDQAREILPVAAELVDRLDLPVINHPQKIMRTGRAAVSELLASIGFCRVPQVRAFTHDELAAAIKARQFSKQAMPFLVRVAGTHGGHDFEKIDELPALARFAAQHSAANFYLTEYIDYQSADGFYRKYRFVFVGDEILPYHLAIGGQWKVHHCTTDMANQPWMQREEEAFLNEPTSVFQARHYATLRSIQQAIGLDYFGIDCAVDREGNVVVFEVNATMLVHRENGCFSYKTPHIDRIQAAFDAMLRKSARSAEWPLAHTHP